jgi:hypothetical protein
VEWRIVGENPRNKGFENSCQVALKNSLAASNVKIPVSILLQ